MNLKHIALAFVAAGLLFAACEKEEDLGTPRITVTPSELSLDQGESSQTVELLATRDWYISSKPDWAALSAETGDASTQTQKVTVSVNANSGNDRTGEIIFNIGLAKAALVISQKGAKGEVNNGSGTLEDPYSVAGVIAYTTSLGSDVQSPNSVYFYGRVTEVATTYEASGTYGNATFYIASPDDLEGERFYVFQTYYLGNRKWKSGDTDINAGDDVIVYGPVVNYKGNTPETAGKGASFVYSLNGKTEGDAPSPVDPSSVEQITCAEFIARADQSTPYRLVGEVTSSVNTSYCSFDMSDGTATVVVWTVNNKDEWKDVVKKGGTVTVRGTYQPYTDKNGNVKHEMVDAYIEAFEAGSDTTQDEITASTVADFISTASTDTYYRLTGTVSSFATGTTSAGKNWMQFDLTDDTGSILVYGFKDGQYDAWASKLKDGGTVVLTGTYEYYEKKSQHEVMNATIESFTEGETPPIVPTEPSGSGTLEDPFNAAGVVAYIDSDSYDENAQVYVKGKISYVKYTFDVTHGTATFDISDDGTTSVTQFSCYGVYYLENKSWLEGFSQVKVGDDVVIYGKVILYNDSIYETSSRNAYIYSLNGQTEAEEVEGGGGGGEQTGGDFTSTVTWTSGSDQSYTQDATVNGTAGVSVLKLGTGSKAGVSTLTLPAAASKISFYAISWKDKPSKLVFKVGDTEVASCEPAANAGLSGNPTYTLSVTDSDHYTIDLGSAVTEVTVETSGSNTRAALFAIVTE